MGEPIASQQEYSAIDSSQYRLETGIGRPVDSEWLADFQYAFAGAARPSLNLELRKRPGIVYVEGPALKRPLEIDRVGEEGESLIEQLTARLTSNLCSIGLLDAATAWDTFTLSFAKADFRNNEWGMKVGARVRDKTNPFYPSRQQIGGEKNKIRDFLGLPRDEAEKSPSTPSYSVNLGLIIGPPRDINRLMLDGISKYLKLGIRLSGVGNIRTAYTNTTYR